MTEKPNSPVISIIVPVYNVESYLPRCLNSIRAQTFGAWECICVDDGSTDKSGAILDEYAANDSRFIVIHNENGGTSAARNAGLDAARGKYIGFVDGDDWIAGETYALAFDTAMRTDADIVQWEYTKEPESKHADSKEVLSEGFFRAELEHKYFCPSVCVKLFRRTLIFENGIRFPVGIRRGEDCSFSLLAYSCAKKCFYLSRSLYRYDKTRQSSITSSSMTAEALLDAAEERKKVCALVEKKLRSGKDFGKGGGKKISQFLFVRKAEAKSNFLFVLPEPDLRLFRSCFPELNRRMFAWFLKERTKKAFVSLLAAWHLDALVRAFFSRRRKKRKAKTVSRQ